MTITQGSRGRAAGRLDQPHATECPVARGADPDLCRCDLDPTSVPSIRTDRPATAAELRRMQAMLHEAGITDRAERLARTGELVGRTVASCSGLSERETRVVCAWLDRRIAGEQR